MRLLALLYNFRWITEIKAAAPVPIEDRIRQLAPLLESLGFAHAHCQRYRKEGGEVRWIQIAANQAILARVISGGLCSAEMGLLYGYPTSSILAFSGLIEKRCRVRKEPAEHYLSGVLSDPLFATERRHFSCIWRKLKKICPAIIEEAEKALVPQGCNDPSLHGIVDAQLLTQR